MCSVTLSETYGALSLTHIVCTGQNQPILTIVDPSGNIQYVCLSNIDLMTNSGVLVEIDQWLNNIIN